jgi:phosphoglycolate phosphatase
VSGARFDPVLLDLDGTLLDTRADLVASTNHVRAAFGMPPLADHEVERLVGHGARVLVERALGPGRGDVHAQALRSFLEHYEAHCLDRTTPYPGMRELLHSLSERRVRFAVLTNKAQRLARKILEGLRLLDGMAAVVGGDTFPERKPHPRGVLHVLEHCAAEPSGALLVGDSVIDVETAKAAGVAMCAVTWGFDPESLAVAETDFVAHDAAELGRIIVAGDE